MRYEHMDPGELLRAAEDAATTGLEKALLEALKQDPWDGVPFDCPDCDDKDSEIDDLQDEVRSLERRIEAREKGPTEKVIRAIRQPPPLMINGYTWQTVATGHVPVDDAPRLLKELAEWALTEFSGEAQNDG